MTLCHHRYPPAGGFLCGFSSAVLDKKHCNAARIWEEPRRNPSADGYLRATRPRAPHLRASVSGNDFTGHGVGEAKLDERGQPAPGTDGELWQPRFFDRALRTVKEHNEKVEYIHLNPRVAPTSAFMSATLKKPGQATDRTR